MSINQIDDDFSDLFSKLELDEKCSDNIHILSEEKLQTETFEHDQPNQEKKRCSVEYNSIELITALLLLYPTISNYNELQEKVKLLENSPLEYKDFLYLNHESDFLEYIKEIPNKKLIITKIINNFRTEIKTYPQFERENIKCVYISGKCNTHIEIKELNKNQNKLECKSDIYVKFVDDTLCGISIKQSKDATKTNYSVQKMLGKEEDALLTNIRKKYFNDNGIFSLEKSNRAKMNSLFYRKNKENPYWIELKKHIENKKSIIIDKLTNPLFCKNINYDVYEFNGETFKQINKQNENLTFANADFYEHEPYYFDKKGGERNAAKLFYRLVVGDNIYKVEIRWKGDMYNSSPQFQCHEDS